jgi:probable rRNA maturation factor
MSPDEPHHAAPLHVVITDEIGRPLRKPSLSRWLQSLAPARAQGSVTVALVSEAAIRRLNRQYAGVDHATDVLSFPDGGDARRRTSKFRGSASSPRPDFVEGRTSDGRAGHLGDIAIATGVARRQARAARHSLDTELRVLALHGLLHLLGYDHAGDGGRMARLERRLRRRGGLREGLIDRASSTRLPRRSSLAKSARAEAGRGRAKASRRARR